MRGLVILLILIVAVFAPALDFDDVYNVETFSLENATVEEINSSHNQGEEAYVVNLSTKKYHLSSCRYATSKNENNLDLFNDEEFLIKHGYQGCKKCIK